MCTISVIAPTGTRGLRVAVNRDERRTRSLAWAPRLEWRDDVPVVWPVDSDSLGTWVAAAGTGLVWALLNGNSRGAATPRPPRTSRGHIIPRLAGATHLAAAHQRFSMLDLEQFAPFRLVVVSAHEIALFEWDGTTSAMMRSALGMAEIVSSSSLGDHLVEGPRRELFDQLLTAHADPWRAQDHLHQHSWPDRRHVSVLMSRPLARTVSRTVVVMEAAGATMCYAPVVDGWIGPVTNVTLNRTIIRQAMSA